MRQVRESTARLLLDVEEVGGQDARGPSLLPGWSRGHVLTHLARNGDALSRLLEGATRGEHPPMYDSDEGRDADIEAGAGRPADQLTQDVRDTAQRLDEAWKAMLPEHWDLPVRMRGGPVAAADTIIARWREVEIHRVDLDLGYGPDEWPPAFCTLLLDTETGAPLARRLPDGIAVTVHAIETGGQWWAGERDATQVAVHGPSWALACWLVGRPGPAVAALKTEGGELPELAPWR